jgi:hypothetical protein
MTSIWLYFSYLLISSLYSCISNLDDDLLLNNCDQATLHHNHSSNSSSINNRQIDNNHSESIHSHHYQQAHKSLDSNDSIHIDSHNSNGLSDSVAHNGFHKSNSSARVQSTNPSNDSYKTIKSNFVDSRLLGRA